MKWTVKQRREMNFVHNETRDWLKISKRTRSTRIDNVRKEISYLEVVAIKANTAERKIIQMTHREMTTAKIFIQTVFLFLASQLVHTKGMLI